MQNNFNFDTRLNGTIENIKSSTINTQISNKETINSKNNFKSNTTATITIDARYKEMYYHNAEPVIKESQEALRHRHIFWNYMMHESMQNTISQMKKVC